MQECAQPVLAMPPMRRLFTPAVSILLVLMVGCTVVNSLVGGLLIPWFGVSTDGLRQGYVWQLFTYGWVDCVRNMIMNALVLMFLGSSVEREWKTVPFLKLWATLTVLCGLCWCGATALLHLPYLGTGGMGATFGLVAVYGYLFRRQRILFFMWPMEAQHLMLLYFAILVLLCVSPPIALVWVLGAGIGWIYVHRVESRKDNYARPRSPQGVAKKGFVDLD